MTEQTLKFDAEVGKILHLMIHSLYEKREIFLRELISNASDACDKLRYDSLIKPDLIKDNPDFKIQVCIDKKNKTLVVQDNGIGMTKDEMIKNLGTIARSGTQNFLEKLTGEKQKDINLIGQFGVGFYSSYMVADRVLVISKKAGEDSAALWESEGKGEFKVSDCSADFSRGTKITLMLKDDCEEYLDKWRLRHIISTYSEHVAFPIELIDEEGKAEVVNSASALWLKPKSEITEEQYKEFYHHVGQAGDAPWMTIHNKAEGALEYTSLLFIPSTKPFDLFHPDRTRRVKLYVKRIFITDQNVEIIPAYLRFLRGIVDSEDLPLNISRETLQHNALLGKIRNSVTKKVFSELKKKATEKPDEFQKFWDNFGPVLKEGLCDALEPRDDLLEVCRFTTTKSGDGLVSLKEYKQRIKEGQKAIYYIVGDSVEALRKSPQIEGFVSEDIEVILLHDSVDDFWVNVVSEYDGLELKSVTRVSDDLKNIKSEDKEGKKSKKKKSTNDKDLKELVEFFKKVLGEKVKEVRVSTKLKESPVCLAVQEGAMDIRMERFLVDNKQLPGRMAKILEINPSHKIIKSLLKDFKNNDDNNKVHDAVFLLFDQANIIEGEAPQDVAGFSQRINKLLEKALAA